MKDQYLVNGVKIKFSKEYPGDPGLYDTKKGWSLENEIAWTENYISRLENQLQYQDDRLNKLYLQRAWWSRFLRYCQTGV